ICRIGFMRSDDAYEYTAKLADKGLTPFRDDRAEDVAVVGHGVGFLKACTWLELGEFQQHAIAWLANAEPGDICAPAGWSPDRAMQHLSAAEMAERFEFVGCEGNVDVYREKATGVKHYVGRTSSFEIKKHRHDTVYMEACDLIDGLILLDG